MPLTRSKIPGGNHPHRIAWLGYAFCSMLMLAYSAGALADKGDGIIDPGENRQEELARAAQNPVASLISLPLQNNTNFEFGPEEKTQNVLNVQPVIPFEVSENWNLITRTICPSSRSRASSRARIVRMGLVMYYSPLSWHPNTAGTGSGVRVRPFNFPLRAMIKLLPTSGQRAPRSWC